MSTEGKIAEVALPLVTELIKLLSKLVEAGEDDAAQEDALMEAEAAIARERARRKFFPRGGA